MARYVAFLRGINVAGRRIKGEDLKVPFEEMGLEEVDTYLVSGNVVFTTGERDTARLADRIEDQLRSSLGWDVPVFLRTAQEVRAIAAHEPFEPEELQQAAGSLQVVLLETEPDGEAHERVAALEPDDDRVALHGRELYWLPDGTMRSADLSMAAIDDAVGPMTMRTHDTVQRLAERYFPAEEA